MYGNDSSHKCKRILRFEDAEKLFALPSCKGKAWSVNERPLNGNDKHHYRVERLDEDTYDVLLYNTVLARYYRPKPDGRRLVEYGCYDTTLTKNFMWQVLSVRYGVNTGRAVSPEGIITPVWWPLTTHQLPIGWMARITYLDGRILTAESQICRMGKTGYTDKEKELRKKCSEPFQSLIDLACIAERWPYAGNIYWGNLQSRYRYAPNEENTSEFLRHFTAIALGKDTWTEKQAACKKWLREELHPGGTRETLFPLWAEPPIQNPVFGLKDPV